MGGVVWIASYPRSGNTWIRVFLHALLNVMEGREDLDLNTLAEFSTWDIASQWYEPLLGKPPDAVTKEAVAAARPMAQRRIADSVDGLVFVKTHAALVKDRGTPTIDMTRTAGAVYVVRNPLDVAISYAKHLNMPIARSVHILNAPRFETDNFPKAVYEFYGSWSQHVTSWTRRPHPAVRVVRYEDLLAEPLAAFTGLADHLRIEASQEQIRSALRLASFDRLSGLEAKTGFREKPPESSGFFRKGTAGQWRDELPEPLVEEIIAAHGDAMRKRLPAVTLAPARTSDSTDVCRFPLNQTVDSRPGKEGDCQCVRWGWGVCVRVRMRV